MELIEPSPSYIASYREALKEFEGHHIFGFWKLFGPIDDEQSYVDRIQCYQHVAGSAGDTIPATVYWLVDGGEFVGHVSVRHALIEPMTRRGGHIGYAIRPSRHRQGYGTEILRRVLPHARSLGISSALLTCDSDNLASRKIIEKNGGVFSKEIEVNGKLVQQHFR